MLGLPSPRMVDDDAKFIVHWETATIRARRPPLAVASLRGVDQVLTNEGLSREMVRWQGALAAALTKRVVDAAEKKDRRYFVWDSELSGFGFVVGVVFRSIESWAKARATASRARFAISPLWRAMASHSQCHADPIFAYK